MTAQQPAPATPPGSPIPQPNVPPAGPWTPWPDPTTRPHGPRYVPTTQQRLDARRVMAQHQGDLDGQAHAALAVVLAHVGMLADHLEHHSECDGTCEALVTHVRTMVATRNAFDAAVAVRRGIAINPIVPGAPGGRRAA